MEYDRNKVDEATLALLYLNMWNDKVSTRAWKGFDWDTLDRLYEKGFIYDPKGKAKSIVFTPEGEDMSEKLFHELFGSDSKSSSQS
jgi:hypothetical protein